MTAKLDIPALLTRVENALNDWIRTDYPDVCESYRIEESQKRIQDNGGTLAYIADLLIDVKATRQALGEKP